MDGDKDLLKILEKYDSMLDPDNLSDENIDHALNVLSKDLETLSVDEVEDFKNDQVIELKIQNNIDIKDVIFNNDSSITLCNGEGIRVDVNRFETVKIYTGYSIDLPENTILSLKNIDGDSLTPIDYIIDSNNKLYIILFNSKTYDYIINPSEPICKAYLTPILSKEYIKIKQ